MPADRSLLAPAHHGALDFNELERLGLDPETMLDFSVNSNPFGPSPYVREALASVPIERYPDKESISLRRALAGRMSISSENIIIGNGASELIWLAAFALIQTGSDVLILGPTFGEYERAARLVGANPQPWDTQASSGFSFDHLDLTRKLDSANYRTVFICNPNNPTGQILPAEVIASWAASHPETLFIVDEAYFAFVPGMNSILRFQHKNILILRSMTKDYALAGLRLGYAIGDKPLIHAIGGVRPPWNVNALAQAAGLAALQDETYYQQALIRLQAEKRFLVHGLEGLGYTAVPSHTHFFLLPVGDGRTFRSQLLPHGIVVRDCASFGLPIYVRISPRTRDENIRLLSILSKLKNHTKTSPHSSTDPFGSR